MYLQTHPVTPDRRKMHPAFDLLRQGGLLIYPTDTIYALGCDINHRKAIERLMQLKGLNPAKANLSIICSDMSDVSHYAKISDFAFRLMKRNLPGPFTFILPATNNLPKWFRNKKKTVGIRIPQNNIAQALIGELGNPIVSTSLHHDDPLLEYPTDPELIYEKYQNEVDALLDGGYGNNVPSTVVNLLNDEVDIVRPGKGEIRL